MLTVMGPSMRPTRKRFMAGQLDEGPMGTQTTERLTGSTARTLTACVAEAGIDGGPVDAAIGALSAV